MIKKHLFKFLLGFAVVFAIGVFFVKWGQSPPCLNADEASFAYNAYSILKTGRDEYGTFLPLRLKSFGDYKMPLLSYLDIPWIATLGLNETGARLVNFPFVVLFPIVIYLLALELFKNKLTAIIAAFLVTFSVGLQSIGRQTHEAYSAVFLLSLATYFFVRYVNKGTASYFYLFVATFFIDLFGYQSTRIWSVFFLAVMVIMALKKNFKKKYILIFLAAVVLFEMTDVIYKPTRVSSLLFYNNVGFRAKIYELRVEGGLRFLYNGVVVGAKQVADQYFTYFSPQFLALDGDQNPRFGYPGMGPITLVEYALIFVGLYFIFKNKEKWRYLVLALLLFSPGSAIFAWQDASLTRALFIIIPCLIIAAYGASSAFKEKKIYFIAIMAIYLMLVVYNWDFYLNHYPKRALVVRDWQCGYKQLGDYVKENYHKFDRFYITTKNGQPYIFLLFYLKYPPAKYQKVAHLSPPDQYGFGQVMGFDKFIFSMNPIEQNKKVVLIGYPDDFGGLSDSEKSTFQKIIIRTQEMFDIYVPPVK